MMNVTLLKRAARKVLEADAAGLLQDEPNTLGPLRDALAAVESEPQCPPGTVGAAVWPGALKSIEECSELGQVLAKLLAFPDGTHPDGTNVVRRTEKELADALAALDYLIQANPLLDADRIAERHHKKLTRFTRWHEEERAGLPTTVPDTEREALT